jgi:hypothetical protein
MFRALLGRFYYHAHTTTANTSKDFRALRALFFYSKMKKRKEKRESKCEDNRKYNSVYESEKNRPKCPIKLKNSVLPVLKKGKSRAL